MNLQLKRSGVTAVGEADTWRSDQLREASMVFPTRPGTSPALVAQNLLTTCNQKWQWLCHPEHSHSRSRYSPTFAFSSYLAYAEAFCYASYTDMYTCTHPPQKAVTPSALPVTATLMKSNVRQSRCRSDPSARLLELSAPDGTSGTDLYCLPGPPQKTLCQHWVNKTSC